MIYYYLVVTDVIIMAKKPQKRKKRGGTSPLPPATTASSTANQNQETRRMLSRRDINQIFYDLRCFGKTYQEYGGYANQAYNLQKGIPAAVKKAEPRIQYTTHIINNYDTQIRDNQDREVAIGHAVANAVWDYLSARGKVEGTSDLAKSFNKDRTPTEYLRFIAQTNTRVGRMFRHLFEYSKIVKGKEKRLENGPYKFDDHSGRNWNKHITQTTNPKIFKQNEYTIYELLPAMIIHFIRHGSSQKISTRGKIDSGASGRTVDETIVKDLIDGIDTIYGDEIDKIYDAADKYK